MTFELCKRCGASMYKEHHPNCPYDEIDRLRAENEAWIEAFGVLTTLHEKMLIDTANPMGMAKQVEAHVRQRIAELEAALREISELNFSLPLQKWAVHIARAALSGKE